VRTIPSGYFSSQSFFFFKISAYAKKLQLEPLFTCGLWLRDSENKQKLNLGRDHRILYNLLSLSCFGFFAHGQYETVITPTDKFDISVNNSSVSFAVDGTYEQASLENGVWSFVNLGLSNFQSAEKLNLKVSAYDSSDDYPAKSAIAPSQVQESGEQDSGILWLDDEYQFLTWVLIRRKETGLLFLIVFTWGKMTD
jgi:hypothetical protein